MDGQAYHEGLSGTNPQVKCVTETRLDCPHSFARHVLLSYDVVGCFHHQTVWSGSVAHLS